VKTVTRKNKKYIKNSLNYYFVIKDSNDVFYGQTLFTPKNRRANVIHEAKSVKSAVKIVRSSSFVSEARKKEKAYDRKQIC
jgi:aromatic ring hydroxylase